MAGLCIDFWGAVLYNSGRFRFEPGFERMLIMDNRQIRFVAPGVAEVVPVSVGEPGRGTGFGPDLCVFDQFGD